MKVLTAAQFLLESPQITLLLALGGCVTHHNGTFLLKKSLKNTRNFIRLEHNSSGLTHQPSEHNWSTLRYDGYSIFTATS